MRAEGAITRGTTHPNRLRRVDRWIAHRFGRLLTGATDPLVVDLGFGASPVTSVELRDRLAVAVRPDIRVIGVEVDRARVAAAQPFADPPSLRFCHGGFELAGLRPVLVRAMNVLRQYEESTVDSAWARMTDTGAWLVEGTCDELGRLACWVAVDSSGARSLTLATKLSTLDSPETLAERLPKALIHHNIPGEPTHHLFTAMAHAWRVAGPYAAFGPRQRWRQMALALRTDGWPVLDGPARWRLGELTLDWSAVQR